MSQVKNAARSVMTTGEISEICQVAPRTVSKWFDSGMLKGYRIPGSKDRRVETRVLVAFLKKHGMPLNGLVSSKTRVLIIEDEVGSYSTIRDIINKHGKFEIEVAHGTFQAGFVACSFTPDIIIFNGKEASTTFFELKREIKECLQDIKFILASNFPSSIPSAFDAIIPNLPSIFQLNEAIDDVMAIVY